VCRRSSSSATPRIFDVTTQIRSVHLSTVRSEPHRLFILSSLSLAVSLGLVLALLVPPSRLFDWRLEDDRPGPLSLTAMPDPCSPIPRHLLLNAGQRARFSGDDQILFSLSSAIDITIDEMKNGFGWTSRQSENRKSIAEDMLRKGEEGWRSRCVTGYLCV
jgi:hypothetical protein